MTEVETQALAVDKRTLLAHMFAQQLAQRGMQQVGRRVVQRRRLAYGVIHHRLDLRADFQRTTVENAMMQKRRARLGGVTNIEAHPLGSEVAAIADLATGLGVERGAIQHHDALLARRQFLYRHAFLEQRDDLAGITRRLIAAELGFTFDLDQAIVIHAKGAGRTSPLALGLHFTFEAGFVQCKVALASDVIGQVDRKAVGIVQLEHHAPRDDATLERSEILLEDSQPLFERLGELLFFIAQHTLDMRLLNSHQKRKKRQVTEK